MKNRLTYFRKDVLKGSQESYTVDTSLNLSKQLTHSPHGKITQRLSSSPFNLPLKNAIDQLQKTKNETQLRRNSYGCASIKHNPPSHHRRFSISQNRNYENIHSQTYAFLQKYFSLTSLDIPVNLFIQNVLIQYAGLWGCENTHKVQKGFSIMAKRLLGNKSIKIPHLIELTSQDGMIGLVLTIFREMKSEQNHEDQLNSISSITFSNNYQDNFWNDSFYRIQKQLQQWMLSMFRNLENQFICLLNKQLKRIIIKIKESQTILSNINRKIAENDDILSLEKQIRALKVKNDNNESKKQKLEQQIQRILWKLDKSQKQRENFKNKYENAQIQFQKIETFLINSAFYKNNDVPSNPPIEIKISTHFITQTTQFTTKK